MFVAAEGTNADFTDAVMERVRLNDAQMHRGIFRYARLPDANLSGANLSGGDLSMADLRGNLNEVNLSQADLRGADLTGANLTGANLRLANMFDAKLADAKLSRIHMDGAIGPHGQRVGNRAAGKKPARPWWQFWG